MKLATDSRPAIWIAAATVVLGVSLLSRGAIPLAHHMVTPVTDDAEYYRLIARNIARTGRSTFDGQVLTNGYHPLWLWTLAIIFRLFGESKAFMVLAGGLLAAISFFFITARSGVKSPLVIAVAMAVFAKLAAPLVLSGMELGLEFACASVLLFVLCSRDENTIFPRWATIGLSLSAAVFARIDALLFLVPLVAVFPEGRRVRLSALALFGGIFSVYLTYNLVTFGTPMPISGAVKSLGGLQLNHRFLDQLHREIVFYGLDSAEVQMVIAFAASPILIMLSESGSPGRALSVSLLIGGCAFIARILFGSSWEVWQWYNFPLIFAFAAGLFIVGPKAEALIVPWSHSYPTPRAIAEASIAAVLLLLTLKTSIKLFRPSEPSHLQFDAIDRLAVQDFGPILANQRLAMGDRAGEFAANYQGGVTQMEGLVNNVSWLRAIKSGRDVTPILCKRGVKFIASYQRDLGNYKMVTFPILRPFLTQFPSPTLTFDRGSEVGHVSDLQLVDLRNLKGEPLYNTLYIWHLNGCA